MTAADHALADTGTPGPWRVERGVSIVRCERPPGRYPCAPCGGGGAAGDRRCPGPPEQTRVTPPGSDGGVS